VGARFSAPVQTGPRAHSVSYRIDTGSFSGEKRPGRDVYLPYPYNAEVKERVKTYLFSPSGPSLSVLGLNLPLPHLYLYRTKKFKILTYKPLNTFIAYSTV
jgi:hypothetical protein